MIKILPKALIFDLNGTMVDDMAYHTKAWHAILSDDLGATITFEELKMQMYGKNEELLIRVFGNDKFRKEEIKHLSIEKEKKYQQAFLPELKLVAGLEVFLNMAKEAGLKTGIGSAAINFNIDFVLDNLHIRHLFDAIVSADNVEQSKPDPETFLKVASLLQVAPEECIVFEDAPKGVEAALNAGMQTVALLTMHEKSEFSNYNNILQFITDYNDPFIKDFFDTKSYNLSDTKRKF
jgi:beta-phosphoglucomutase family hydrolase